MIVGWSCSSGLQRQTLTQRDAHFPSALGSIKDNGNALYTRINGQGYEECRDDILAVSGLAEDIRDAVLEYQVGGDGP